MKRFSLQGKTAIVTGGSSGIGKATAIALAEQGASVHILDMDLSAAQVLAERVNCDGGKAIAHKCDVVEKAAVEGVISRIAETENVDILINNAGIAHIGDIENTSEADLDRVYNVNVKGVYHCTRAVIPGMKKKGGVILNMASIASSVGLKDRFAYSMSKGAVLTMTYSVAKDYLEYGIRCNCIAPARVHTSFVDGFIAKNYPGQEKTTFEKLSKTQPIGRMGKPEEIANLVVYLCSDEASFVTGSNFPIDGGFVTLKG